MNTPQDQALQLSRFINEKWRVVGRYDKLKNRIDSMNHSCPKRKFAAPMDSYNSYHPDRLLDFISTFGNQRRDLKNICNKKRNIKEISILDAKFCFVILNKSGCPPTFVLRKVLLQSSPQLGKTILFDQSCLSSSCPPLNIKSNTPSPSELETTCSELGKIWSDNWNLDHVEETAADESVYTHKPRMKRRKRSEITKELPPTHGCKPETFDFEIRKLIGNAPIPHIASKPNGDGLLAYGIGVKATRTDRPYMLNMIPHLGEGLKIESVVKKLLSVFPTNHQLSVTLDSRFCSWETAENLSIQNPNHYFVISMSINKQRWLWEVLENNLPVGRWRAAFNPNNGFLVSVKRNEKSSHYLLSNL